jgi:hypothetical protein
MTSYRKTQPLGGTRILFVTLASIALPCLIGVMTIHALPQPPANTSGSESVSCWMLFNEDASKPRRDIVLCDQGQIIWQQGTRKKQYTVKFDAYGSPFGGAPSMSSDSNGYVDFGKATSITTPMAFRYSISPSNGSGDDPHVIVLGKGKDGKLPND